MESNFDRAFALLSVHEGGYVNHPDDPGGATNRGVTQRTYDDYRRRKGLRTRSVREITTDEVVAIYRFQYWDAVRADDLPSGVDYCVFDAAVNSGPGRAAKWLQAMIGATQDGIVGNQTIRLSREQDPTDLINRYCDRRLAFMRSLRHWPTFARGWTARVADVRNTASRWARDLPVTPAMQVAGAVEGRAEGGERAAVTTARMFTNPAALSAIGGLMGSAGAAMTGDGPVQYSLAAILVIAALTGVWWLVRGREE